MRHRLALAVLLLVAALLLSSAGRSIATADAANETPPGAAWEWPVEGPRIPLVPYLAPVNDYGTGHRGIDLTAPIGGVATAPADGIVAFRGLVVDRPVLTIDHGGGVVSSYEPLLSSLEPGTLVAAGEPLGTVDIGGHSAAGTLHLGVRVDGAYMNPEAMFGLAARAILLPCCAAP